MALRREGQTKRIFSSIKFISEYMYWVAGIALMCIILVTVCDVIGRTFGAPITGVYDITILCGGIVGSFALPFSTLKNVHIRIETLLIRLPPRWTKILGSITLSLGMLLFMVLGVYIILHAISIYEANQVSGVLFIPLYPFFAGIGVGAIMNSFILLYQLSEIMRKENEG